MCRVLGVARSTYYEVTSRPFSKRRSRKNSLKKKILLFWRESGKKYGAPKLHVLLQNEGHSLSLRTVSRYMQEIGIRSITVKKYRPVNSIGTIQERENLLEGDFTTESIHEKWCTDITYIHTVKDGWTYLASVLDLHSRKIVGYAYGKNMTTELAVKAVQNALFNTRPSSRVVLHSDLGTQYTSDEFMSFTTTNNLLQSFSAKGNPYHNAPMESFHAILKKEEVHRKKYYDYQTAKRELFIFIEGWYNRKRIHSAIGYQTPHQAHRFIS